MALKEFSVVENDVLKVSFKKLVLVEQLTFADKKNESSP